jgi:hypothetical protein
VDKDTGLMFQELDMVDTIKFIVRKGKKFEAVALNEIETILINRPELYEKVRKVYLDSFNSYKRSILRAIFGDVDI